MRSLPPARNQSRIRCRCLLWRQDFHRVEEVQVENSHPHGKTRTHMGKLAPTSLVATRFHLVGEVQVGNSHPHGKTRTHMGWENLQPPLSCGDEISSCRRHVQVENSHPHGKTRTHNLSGPAPRLLWRQDFHLVEGMCKLENLHPHGKTCSTFERWRPADTVPES